ncbi:MAG: response regulator transcription factor [Burkholderia sp.]|jgi:DNA-binding NarL/FixJ family response regulator|uniref:response regulator n=1 Tax=Burkholderia sp. TaxID=36773 RepID=UPI00258C42D6|nr:response regulator transcription factor [Burkholderia sp.]MCA3781054.1 response regulator transcription factor [Burkholderia sp.]MCA3789423.1 response regulator transcription factor [Burkholderia sp.]MCA3795360.1 response regulator transcription factor [Burkholderia sp.]MCA3804927.1 response regulator transcription factor [Burkholderia sp.]MCA3813908.1 response regulator transcription factor [Burkholderia sp.]
MIKVVISDAHAVMREGVRDVLGAVGDFDVAGEATDGAGTLELVRALKPRVLSLGWMMSGIHGVDLIRQIKKEHQDVRVLVLTAHSEQTHAVRAFRAGASGFLSKTCSRSDLVDAVRKLADGGVYVSTMVGDLLAQVANGDSGTLAHHRLTEREFEVLVGLASGQSISQMAGCLSISIKTVSTYKSRILEKLDLTNESDMIRFALRHQLLDLGDNILG